MIELKDGERLDDLQRVLPEATVHSFENADDAIDFAKENRVDIAILDITIKGRNGVEVAKELRTIYPKMNIIFCTSHFEDEVDISEVTGSRILMKPMRDGRLKNALENLDFPPHS